MGPATSRLPRARPCAEARRRPAPQEFEIVGPTGARVASTRLRKAFRRARRGGARGGLRRNRRTPTSTSQGTDGPPHPRRSRESSFWSEATPLRSLDKAAWLSERACRVSSPPLELLHRQPRRDPAPRRPMPFLRVARRFGRRGRHHVGVRDLRHAAERGGTARQVVRVGARCHVPGGRRPCPPA